MNHKGTYDVTSVPKCDTFKDEDDHKPSSAVDIDNLKVLIGTDQFTPVFEIIKELVIIHPTVLDHLNKLEKSK